MDRVTYTIKTDRQSTTTTGIADTYIDALDTVTRYIDTEGLSVDNLIDITIKPYFG